MESIVSPQDTDDDLLVHIEPIQKISADNEEEGTDEDPVHCSSQNEHSASLNAPEDGSPRTEDEMATIDVDGTASSHPEVSSALNAAAGLIDGALVQQQEGDECEKAQPQYGSDIDVVVRNAELPPMELEQKTIVELEEAQIIMPRSQEQQRENRELAENGTVSAPMVTQQQQPETQEHSTTPQQQSLSKPHPDATNVAAAIVEAAVAAAVAPVESTTEVSASSTPQPTSQPATRSKAAAKGTLATMAKISPKSAKASKSTAPKSAVDSTAPTPRLSSSAAMLKTSALKSDVRSSSTSKRLKPITAMTNEANKESPKPKNTTPKPSAPKTLPPRISSSHNAGAAAAPAATTNGSSTKSEQRRRPLRESLPPNMSATPNMATVMRSNHNSQSSANQPPPSPMSTSVTSTPRTSKKFANVHSKINSITDHKPQGGNVKIFSQKQTYTVSSRIGSLANVNRTPGGGNVTIENRKTDFSANAKPRIDARSEHKRSQSAKKIFHAKLDWKAESKIGSKDNINHKPAGGDVKVNDYRVDVTRGSRGRLTSSRASNTSSIISNKSSKDVPSTCPMPGAKDPLSADQVLGLA